MIPQRDLSRMRVLREADLPELSAPFIARRWA
ncbi:hypothetical protein IWY39_004796 [Sphingobium sp. JAI105]|jgi:hypothetical protein|nr:hypothetical protein [Sphingobium sp. JAI105]